MTRSSLIRVWAFLIFALGILLPTAAQDAPKQVIDAAKAAAKAADASLTEVQSWQWNLLNATNLSSLGCPLVTGTDMGRSITPYRITLIYPQGSYTVHVSADGTLTQLCDSKFGVASGTPVPISSSAGACVVSVAAPIPALLAPNQSAAPVTGTFFTENKNTGIGRSRDNAWIQLRSTEGGYGWIEARTATLAGNCAGLPITAAADEDAALSVCFVMAASAFSNVRERPTVDARQVDQIFENVVWQVHVKSSDGGWYYINPGWVATSVIRTYGNCNNVPVNNDLQGRGSAALTVTALPSNFICPANFAGFMSPRLQIGTGNARVIQDGSGVPNRIRSEPSVNGVFIGEAQPGRTFDKVLDGPACSATYVWWLVEIDGIVGWTVESDSAASEYFLELVATGSVTPTAQPITAPVPVTTLDVNTAPALPTSPVAVSYQAQNLIISPDGKFAAAWSALASQTVRVYTRSTTELAFTPVKSLELDTAIVDLVALPNGQFAVMGADNTLYFFDFATVTEQRKIANVEASPVYFSPDGSLFLTVGCVDAACNQGEIRLWGTQQGQVLRKQPAHVGKPLEALFSPDGSRIASSGDDGVQVWDTRSGAFVAGFEQAAAPNSYSNLVFVQNGQQVVRANCKTFSEFICQLVQLTSWDIASGAVKQQVEAHKLPVINLATNVGGTQLLSTSLDANPILWDTATFVQLTTIPTLSYMVFAPSGGFLLSISDSNVSNSNLQAWQLGGVDGG